METLPQSSTSAYDYLLKILLIGDANCNKRALLRTYLNEADPVSERSSTTLGRSCSSGANCSQLESARE